METKVQEYLNCVKESGYIISCGILNGKPRRMFSSDDIFGFVDDDCIIRGYEEGRSNITYDIYIINGNHEKGAGEIANLVNLQLEMGVVMVPTSYVNEDGNVIPTILTSDDEDTFILADGKWEKVNESLLQ